MTIVFASGNRMLSLLVVSSSRTTKLTTPPLHLSLPPPPFILPNNLLPPDFLMHPVLKVEVPSDRCFLIFGVLTRPNDSTPSSPLLFISATSARALLVALLLLLLLLLQLFFFNDFLKIPFSFFRCSSIARLKATYVRVISWFSGDS